MTRLAGGGWLCVVVVGVMTTGLPSVAVGQQQQATEKEIEGHVAALGDKAKDKRDAAAEKLSDLLGSKDKVEQERTRAGLVKAMKDNRDATVRASAEELLMKRYQARITALLELCGDDSFVVRERACQELIEIGTPALKQLKVEAEKSPCPEIRRRAMKTAEAIEKLGR